MIEVEIHKNVYLDCFHHLLEENDIDIELIWGGRDSGKSKFVAQLFTEESMSLDYFRALLIKQTHESIKDAQWQMIKDTAEQWGVDSLFKFQTSPLGLRCVNGNTFSTRGMDKPGKIRSFSNPSHAWLEEANQMTEEGFINILTGLRSDYGRVKMYITFNPEANTPDFEEFWLYKMFFKNNPNEQNFTSTIDMKITVDGLEEVVSLKYRSTHVTYHDNPYVSTQRRAFHESLKDGNYYWYQVFTLGLWGNAENDSPWAFAFNRKKHTGKTLLNRAHPLICSFDFNRNPMCCSLFQLYDNCVYGIETIKLPRSGVDAICEYITVHYPSCLYVVCGDYSGMSESSLYQEQVTHYKLITHYLKLSDGQLKVKPNPRLHKNSTHVNTILAFFKVILDEHKCKALIFDCEKVKRRADGTIVKEDRDDPTQQSDALDTFRYFCNIFLDWFKPVV